MPAGLRRWPLALLRPEGTNNASDALLGTVQVRYDGYEEFLDFLDDTIRFSGILGVLLAYMDGWLVVKVISMTDEINELFTLRNGDHPHAARLLAFRVFVSTLPFRGIGDGDGAPVNPTKATPPNLIATENPPPSVPDIADLPRTKPYIFSEPPEWSMKPRPVRVLASAEFERAGC